MYVWHIRPQKKNSCFPPQVFTLTCCVRKSLIHMYVCVCRILSVCIYVGKLYVGLYFGTMATPPLPPPRWLRFKWVQKFLVHAEHRIHTHTKNRIYTTRIQIHTHTQPYQICTDKKLFYFIWLLSSAHRTLEKVGCPAQPTPNVYICILCAAHAYHII